MIPLLGLRNRQIPSHRPNLLFLLLYRQVWLYSPLCGPPSRLFVHLTPLAMLVGIYSRLKDSHHIDRQGFNEEKLNTEYEEWHQTDVVTRCSSREGQLGP